MSFSLCGYHMSLKDIVRVNMFLDITLEFEADPQSEAIPFLRLNVQRFILQV